MFIYYAQNKKTSKQVYPLILTTSIYIYRERDSYLNYGNKAREVYKSIAEVSLNRKHNLQKYDLRHTRIEELRNLTKQMTLKKSEGREHDGVIIYFYE